MLVPNAYTDLLQRPTFAHVATLGPAGEPQSTPVWLDWDGANVRISQTTGRQKYRNLQRDARIALSVIDPDQPYRYLEIRGRVIDIEDDSDNAFIDRLAKKYIGADTYPYHQPGDQRKIMVIAPEHTTQMG